MTDWLLTEHNLEFLSLKGGYSLKPTSESTLVKMPHCWKSNVAAHDYFPKFVQQQHSCITCRRTVVNR